jgi:hypothetical protein
MALLETTILYKGTPLKITGDNAALVSLSSEDRNIFIGIENSLSTIDNKVTALERTTGIIRPTGAGDVNTETAQFYSVSVANTGLADGEVLGVVIRPGEILNFSADSLNNYFTSFAYDATGTDFVITFIY